MPKWLEGQRLGAPGREGQVHSTRDEDGERGEVAPGPKREIPAEDPCTTGGMRHRTLQAQIGAQLRAIFSDVADEPVPERFLELLRNLVARERT
jgi:hypothetical protein